MAESVTPSPWLYEFLKQWEKFRPTAYLPTKNDVPTIGFGHCRGVKMSDTCTLEDAEDWLHADSASASACVSREVTVPLTQAQYDALVSLTFNIGNGAFTESTLLRKLNDSDYAGAQEQFHVWKKQAGGKTLAGLVKRRAAEAEHFGSTAPASPPKP